MTPGEEAVVVGMFLTPFLVIFTALGVLWLRQHIETTNATGWVGLPEDVADDLEDVWLAMYEAQEARR